MTGQFFFTALAGLARSVAGFDAVVATFRRDAVWSRTEIWRLRTVRLGFVCMFLALAPLPLYSAVAGDPAGSVWLLMIGMMIRAPIWLITGIPGAGKTSVCARLASRYAAGLHLETDAIDEFGLHLSGEMDRPVRRLVFRRGVALLSAEFAMSGVAVVIDDTLETDEERRAYTDRLKNVRLVHLLPPLEVALARNATRTNKPEGDAPMLDRTARRLYPRMRAEHTAGRGWYVFDPSGLDAPATVDALIERFGLEEPAD